MINSISIAVDAMGGENAPYKVVKGIEIHHSNSKNIFYMDPWTWTSPEYEFVVEGDKKIIKVEIDPSKRIADVNQFDNSFEID